MNVSQIEPLVGLVAFVVFIISSIFLLLHFKSRYEGLTSPSEGPTEREIKQESVNIKSARVSRLQESMVAASVSFSPSYGSRVCAVCLVPLSECQNGLCLPSECVPATCDLDPRWPLLLTPCCGQPLHLGCAAEWARRRIEAGMDPECPFCREKLERFLPGMRAGPQNILGKGLLFLLKM